jgi:hypothetical protein
MSALLLSWYRLQKKRLSAHLSKTQPAQGSSECFYTPSPLGYWDKDFLMIRSASTAEVITVIKNDVELGLIAFPKSSLCRLVSRAFLWASRISSPHWYTECPYPGSLHPLIYRISLTGTSISRISSPHWYRECSSVECPYPGSLHPTDTENVLQ